MTSKKIEEVINDPDRVAHLSGVFAGLTAAELLVLKGRITRDRIEWAHDMRQMPWCERVSYRAWKEAQK